MTSCLSSSSKPHLDIASFSTPKLDSNTCLSCLSYVSVKERAVFRWPGLERGLQKLAYQTIPLNQGEEKKRIPKQSDAETPDIRPIAQPGSVGQAGKVHQHPPQKSSEIWPHRRNVAHNITYHNQPNPFCNIAGKFYQISDLW